MEIESFIGRLSFASLFPQYFNTAILMGASTMASDVIIAMYLETMFRDRGAQSRRAMFVLRSLGKLLMGGSQAADLLLLEVGELWKLQSKVGPKGPLINRTKVYKIENCILEAQSSVFRGDKVTLVLRREDENFKYLLYIKDDEEDEVEGLRFDLNSSVEFKRTLTADGTKSCFCWRDTKFGDNNRTEYEFVWNEETLESTIQLFHLTVAQCLYETIHKKVLDSASEDDIKALMIVEEADVEDDHGEKGRTSIEGKISFKSEAAGFYVFDAATNVFVPRSESVVAIISEPVIAPGKKSSYQFTLSILDLKIDSVIHQQSIDPDATLHTDRASNSFIWCHFTKENLVWTFSLRFSSPPALMAFSNSVGQAVYETLNKESFSKVEADDVRYVLNAFNQDVEMTDAFSEEDDDDQYSEEDESEDEQMVRTGASKSDKNAQLAVGYKHDRSFVSRGHQIGVFKHTDDKLTHSTNIEKIKTSEGKLFTPSKMMLHEEDSSLLLMNPDKQNTIYKMDLNRGSIVEEWNVHTDAKVTDIIPDSKYAQMTANKTLIGINSNSLFRIDPRLPGNKRVDSEMKQYVVKNEFTRGATTGKGELALASAKGEIRLFDKLDKRAKTLLPGFGDPITGIDVTESGRLIVATCKNYLLLINTEIAESKGLQGFTKSMGATKPAPVRLQLKPEHIAHMVNAVSFTPARFSTGSSEERSIITSTGQYVITWNLRRVKQGKLFDYQIKKYEDTVVADNFRFGQDRNIVVTLPDHVTMISKKSLAAPSPASLSKKGSRIVDSPF